MHRFDIALSDLPGVRRGMQSEQFVADLREREFPRAETMAFLCGLFGIRNL
jgi:hypothetical protein